MKIVLITTTLVVAILVIGLLGINNSSSSNNIDNAYAQEGAATPEGMNTTMPTGGDITSENKTIPGQIVKNATLTNQLIQ